MAMSPTFLLSACCPSMDRLLLCMLALLWLAQGTFAQSPLAELPNGSIWIATDHFNPERIIPLCSHACFNAYGDDNVELLNRTVALFKCYFSFNLQNDHWAYDSSSNAITITEWRADRKQETYCLDNLNITTSAIGKDEGSSSYFQVTHCTGENTQKWFFEGDGKIRSALSKSGEALYLLASLDGSNLFLGPAQTEGVHLQFTFISVPTNGIRLPETMAAIPSPGGEGSNLVSNGGFELTSPRNTPSNGKFGIDREELDLCYWTLGDFNIMSQKAFVFDGGHDGWYPQEGSNSLLLGADDLVGDATLTQLISTRPRENYSLSFYLAGNPLCENPVKTVRVELSPSNSSLGLLASKTYLFDSTGKSQTNMGWERTSLDFTATTEVTNLTFINSMNAKACAPVIDNVKVVKQGHKISHKISVAVIIGIAVAALIVVFGLLVLVVWLSKRYKLSNEESNPGDNKADEESNPVENKADEERNTGDNKADEEWNTGDNKADSLGDIRTFSMGELARATNNFTDKVGEGGFGAVYRANLEGNRTGAVKRATKRGIRDQKVFKEELSVHLRICHPYLVKLIGLCFERGEQILVFEFVPKGSLYDRLHKNKGVANPLPWASRVDIAFQVAVALEYLHEEAKPPVVHRDIKSSNVLLIDDSHAKLADFGLSKLGPKKNESTFTVPKGSYGYMDPQYIKTGKLSLKSDVYSFGVLLLELVTGLKSVQGTVTLPEWTESQRLSEDTTVLMEIVDSNVRANVDSKEAENIIKISNLCLASTRKLRPSMSHIVTAMKNMRPSMSHIVTAMNNNEPMPSIKGTESAGDERYPSHGGGVLRSESLSLVHEGR